MPASPCTPPAGERAGPADEQSRIDCVTAALAVEPSDSPMCPSLYGHCPAVRPSLSCHPAPWPVLAPQSVGTSSSAMGMMHMQGSASAHSPD